MSSLTKDYCVTTSVMRKQRALMIEMIIDNTNEKKNELQGMLLISFITEIHTH